MSDHTPADALAEHLAGDQAEYREAAARKRLTLHAAVATQRVEYATVWTDSEGRECVIKADSAHEAAIKTAWYREHAPEIDARSMCHEVITTVWHGVDS